MLKGQELISYTLNQMGGDKYMTLYNMLEEIAGVDTSSPLWRAITLINPVDGFRFIQDMILELEDSDNRIMEYLKSYKKPLPKRWGWKRTIVQDGKENVCETVEWYEDRHKCYCDMFKSAMIEIHNAVDCISDVRITNKDDCITIETSMMKDIFELYEMD